MKITKCPLLPVLSIALALASCNETDLTDDNRVQQTAGITTLTATQGGALTRMSHEDDGNNGLIVNWTTGDAFMLYGDNAEVFTTTDNDTKTATFTGNSVQGTDLNAFFPAAGAEIRWVDCYFSVLGQVIDATTPTAHLADYNFMTAQVTVDETDVSNPVFEHQIAVLKFIIKLPDAVTPTAIALSTQDGEYITISQKVSDATPTTAKQLTAKITNANSNEFTAYMAILPSTLKQRLALAVTGTDADSNPVLCNYTVTFDADHEYIPGKVYNATLIFDGTGSNYGTPSVFDNSVAGGQGIVWANGSGTEAAPFLIESAGNLKYLMEQVNAGTTTYAEIYFKLTTDILITADTWIPIGVDNTKAFSGIFDGGGHTIGGELKTTNSPFYFGLFGYTDGATIKNIHMAADFNVKIDVTDAVITHYYGGIIGRAAKTVVTKCNYTGLMDITIENGDRGYRIAKISGYCENSTLESCEANGDLKITSNISPTRTSEIGGIVGVSSFSTITKCANNGSVEWGFETVGLVGGISGSNYASLITYCINKGKIEGGLETGGLVGRNYGSSSSSGSIPGVLHTSHNLSEQITGSVTAEFTGSLVGRILGNNGTLYDCCTSVDVPGLDKKTGNGIFFSEQKHDNDFEHH